MPVLADTPTVRAVPLSLDPIEAIACWPADRRLITLCSARPGRRWARWTIMASPRATLTIDDRGPRLAEHVSTGRCWPSFSGVPIDDLAAMLRATGLRDAGRVGPVPFAGGWLGTIAYELGASLEPAARGGRSTDDRRWPLVELAWCPDALVHDSRRNRWWAVGDPPRLDGASVSAPPEADGPDAASLESTLPGPDYEAAAARVVEYVRAGDVFQVNLTQRLTTTWSGDTRVLARRALRASGAWYGAYLELLDGRRVLSLSPELFLAVDPRTRSVVTKPIKGTRSADGDRLELAASTKDEAELNMIVDLMRNDLGRVCRYGSIAVPGGRRIERHPTVLHGVAEVRGVLRDDVGVADLLRATFPPGSVTGAPKIRAMQIIDELEPVPRGPYCGAIGLLGDDGRVLLNVAIRTLVLTPDEARGASNRWTVDYGVGAGIVADSDPALEQRECLVKAEILRHAL